MIRLLQEIFRDFLVEFLFYLIVTEPDLIEKEKN